ncbi:MAG: helix-turn-helix transcriptional regulator [Bacteroidales bacterium]|nr:helix-turn-helix transcriptional regulator [Clostridium sp.]MCM1203082.1 helix-turn-helix transcriptional regulator [Bacteroidales bacterium]
MDIEYFRTILRQKLQEQKLTLNALSLKADLSEDTLRSIIYGKSQDIKLSTMVKIADVLHCSLDELAGFSPYSEKELDIIHRLHLLPDRCLRTIEFILMLEEETILQHSARGVDKIPIYLPTGNMKDGMFYDSSNIELLDISDYPLPLRRITDWGIKIVSRHYEPVYYPNDILLLSQKRFPEFNDTILYVDYSGKLYLRKYAKTGLEPVNGIGDHIPQSKISEYKALGVVLKVAKEFDIEQYR